jgi:putative flavoprotein involved in K+ transport
VPEEREIVVIGGGPAGIATSHELAAAGLEHVVLERGKAGQTWRDRWDSFCLVTPNWSVRLPGGGYNGPDPEGFMHRDEIVAHLERYAASFDAPIREGVEVTALEAAVGGGLLLRSSEGEIHASTVVVSTGAYQRPHRPAATGAVPAGLLQIDAEDYANPDALPPGKVLVIGSGQTGCQLAEELHQSGRMVYLACGRAPWMPRRLEGRDTITWLADTPFFEGTLADLPHPTARLVSNPQATGHEGGHDLHFRVLQGMGVNLLGRYTGPEDGTAFFADDLAESVAFGDARWGELVAALTRSCAAKGLLPPEMPEPPPFTAETPGSLKMDGFGAVIFTSGFRPDYRSWVDFPEAFDDLGFPIQEDGASTVVDGLYFVGVHFLRKRKSSILLGVGEDARIVAQQVEARRARPAGKSASPA